MKKKSNQENIEVPFLRRWFPDLPEEEIRKAEDAYIRYLDIRLRIFERVVREEDEKLTELQRKQGLEEKTSTDEGEPSLPLAS